MNSGLNAILEVSNRLDISGTPDIARYLIQFDTNEIQDVINNKIAGIVLAFILKILLLKHKVLIKIHF
jgi:hypothetical protein